MKKMLSNLPFALLCIALLAVALCVGAVRGWSIDRNEVLSALTGDGSLHTQLEYRAMDAANLAVVAARHLQEDDADLVALRNASQTLLSGTQDAQAILTADAIITDVAFRFAETLPQLPSVQASERDQTYLSMLTAALGKKSSLSHTWTLLVEDFNQRLTTSLTGRLAMLFGVDPLPTMD